MNANPAAQGKRRGAKAVTIEGTHGSKAGATKGSGHPGENRESPQHCRNRLRTEKENKC